MKRDANSDDPDDARAGESVNGPDDPFGDLFDSETEGAGEAVETGSASAEREQRRPPTWFALLKRVPLAQAQLSEAVSAVTPALARDAVAALARTLGRYTLVSPADIDFAPLDIVEAEAPGVGASASDALPHVYAALAVEPGGARVIADVNADFAASIIDRALGDGSAPPDSVRALSTTELAAVEFLWLILARELNEVAGEPLWRVDGVAHRPPSWAEVRPGGGSAPGAPRALVAPVRVGLGALSGLVRFYFDAGTLRALDPSRNPLLRHGRRRAFGERLASLMRIVPDVKLAALVGETELSAVEIAQLEAGDVVVVTQPRAALRGGRFAGRVWLSAGEGEGLTIQCEAGDGGPRAADGDGKKGAAASSNSLDSPRGCSTFKVVAVTAGGAAAAAERSMMHEEQLNEDDAPNEDALDAILLNVRVELAARRMGLDEVARLRPGQLLDLGCDPNDPVDLTVDGRRVARGELVDFEGRLGVRVTHVP